MPVADPALQIWEGQIERKKIWRGKPTKVKKIKDKILFYFIYFRIFFFLRKILGVGGPGPPSPHVGPPLPDAVVVLCTLTCSLTRTPSN
jgi:hypothetical protein